jgi:hypothetical protein
MQTHASVRQGQCWQLHQNALHLPAAQCRQGSRHANKHTRVSGRGSSGRSLELRCTSLQHSAGKAARMQTHNHNWQAGAGATAPAPIPPNQASKQTSTPPARPGPAFFPLPNPPASPPLSPSTPTPGPYFANDHLARRAGAPVCPGLGVKACSGNGIHLIHKND